MKDRVKNLNKEKFKLGKRMLAFLLAIAMVVSITYVGNYVGKKEVRADVATDSNFLTNKLGCDKIFFASTGYTIKSFDGVEFTLPQVDSLDSDPDSYGKVTYQDSIGYSTTATKTTYAYKWYDATNAVVTKVGNNSTVTLNKVKTETKIHYTITMDQMQGVCDDIPEANQVIQYGSETSREIPVETVGDTITSVKVQSASLAGPTLTVTNGVAAVTTPDTATFVDDRANQTFVYGNAPQVTYALTKLGGKPTPVGTYTSIADINTAIAALDDGTYEALAIQTIKAPASLGSEKTLSNTSSPSVEFTVNNKVVTSANYTVDGGVETALAKTAELSVGAAQAVTLSFTTDVAATATARVTKVSGNYSPATPSPSLSEDKKTISVVIPAVSDKTKLKDESKLKYTVVIAEDIADSATTPVTETYEVTVTYGAENPTVSMTSINDGVTDVNAQADGKYYVGGANASAVKVNAQVGKTAGSDISKLELLEWDTTTNSIAQVEGNDKVVATAVKTAEQNDFTSIPDSANYSAQLVIPGQPATDQISDTAYVLRVTNDFGISEVSSPFSIVVDKKNPDLSTFKVLQNNPSGTAEDFLDGIAEADNTLIASKKLTTARSFKVSFNAKDLVPTGTDLNNFDDNSVTVLDITDGASTSVAVTKESSSSATAGNDYSFEVTPTATDRGTTKTYSISVKDKITGNETTKKVVVPFLTDTVTVTKLAFENVMLNNASSTIALENATKSSQITFAYKITSQTPIDKNAGQIVLEMKVDGTLRSIPASNVVLTPVSADAVAQSYEYKLSYTTEDFTDSTVLSNVKLTVYDENGNSAEDKTAIINIDLQNPTINIVDPNYNWSSDLVLHIQYKDRKDFNGEEKEFVSGVKSITMSGVTPTNGSDSSGNYINDVAKSGDFYVKVNPSTSTSGTPVSLNIEDQVGNVSTYSYVFYVDAGSPTSTLTVNDYSAYQDLTGNPVVGFTVEDRDPNGVEIKNYKLEITTPSGQVRTVEGANVKLAGKADTLKTYLKQEDLRSDGLPADGTYTLKLTAANLAGVATPELTLKFTLDNTKPTVDVLSVTGDSPKATIYENTYYNSATGTSYKYGQYYRSSNVTVDISVNDTYLKSCTVKDNGTEIGTAAGKYNISGEGYHKITVDAVDNSGNKPVSVQTVEFVIDTQVPTLSTSLNSSAYTEGSGIRYLNTNGIVNISVADTNKDTTDLITVIKKTEPSKSTEESKSNISEGDQSFTTDADYVVTYQATDKAGNSSAIRTVSFRVDKVAPELSIGGASQGKANHDVTLSYNMNEDFYWDIVSATLKIYKSSDSQGKSLLKTVDYNATNAKSVMSETFTEDGEYSFEFEAQDKCGNKANTTYTFIMDKNAPLIGLKIVEDEVTKDNYHKTKKPVTLTLDILETFYKSEKIKVTVLRTDIDGEVHKEVIEDFSKANNTHFDKEFKDDGIYDIEVSAADEVNAESVKKVHFTIDKTAPVILGLENLKSKDGKDVILNAFDFDFNDENFYKDLTACTISAKMDGIAWDGTTSLEDGSHTMDVTVTDELGNTTTESVTFLLDTKAPNILVTGINDGDRVEDPTTVDVTVQLSDDTLDSVELNGEKIEVTDNKAQFTVNSKGDYKITASAHDNAGNKSSVEVNFTYGAKLNVVLLICIIAATLIAGAIVVLVLKNKKKEK